MNPAEIRALQALRAPGGIDAMQAGERWPANGTLALYALVKRGFAEKIDDTFFITEAGRAACPFRNPEAGKPATPPEVFSMPKGETRLSRQKVLATIVAAGPAGISRRALIDMFAHLVTEQAIDMHVSALNRQQPPVIFKPAKGVLCGIAYANETQYEAQAPAETGQQPASTAAAVTHDIHGTSLQVDHHDVAAPSPKSLAEQMAQIGGSLPDIVEDLTLEKADDIDFAVYSSGQLDIFTPDCAITLKPAVLSKLRAFLGLFQEAV